jgi:hypothetical protein
MIVLVPQNSTTPADSSMWNGHPQHHQNHNQQDGQYKNDSLDLAKSNYDEDKDGNDRNKSISSNNHDDDDGNDDDSLDSNGMIKENQKDSKGNNKQFVSRERETDEEEPNFNNQ